MDYNDAFAISAIGMNLERTRVNVATLNLANANTVQTPGTAGYRPLQVVARAAALTQASFKQLVSQSLEDTVSGDMVAASTPVVTVEPSTDSPRMVYEPGHPLANERGFVAYAGVDSATEMVTLMGAMRAYEANVAAMNTARTLALKALDIGGTS